MVLRATLDIINDGDVNPSMPKIVERSGIPERSIFRYFDDIADLTRQAIAMSFRDVSDLPGLDQIGVGPLEQRIEHIITARLELLERVRYVGRVARMRVFLAPDLNVMLDEVLHLFREAAAEHFEPELSKMSDTDAAMTLDSLTVVMSFESYDVLRRRLDRDLDEITAGWRMAINRLLA
ncbi:hypothetical protein YM304_33250 [Ilumatobacter coccineus YM16-304]|uniref:TetR family transcriptional regulator n=1 Tax=Ilumatobacter coccineus (strain NBRC 103263 / KCTC 29153 / YM16-304) TaxID=1313172 RepID=A0A6C7EEN9_ILUCY|nr:hypothetical protein YM304_33250 [Ilumatobacter coccineus YM16-304]